MKAGKSSAPALRLAYSNGASVRQPLRSNSSAAAIALHRLALLAECGALGGFVIAFENASGGTEMLVSGSMERNLDKAYRAAARLCDGLLYQGEES